MRVEPFSGLAHAWSLIVRLSGSNDREKRTNADENYVPRFHHGPHGVDEAPRTGEGTAARTNRALLGFAALLVVAGCTTTTITPELVTKPSQTYATVAVGEISMQGDLWQNLIPHFEAGLVKGLRESKVFAKTVAPGESTLPRKRLSYRVKLSMWTRAAPPLVLSSDSVREERKPGGFSKYTIRTASRSPASKRGKRIPAAPVSVVHRSSAWSNF